MRYRTKFDCLVRGSRICNMVCSIASLASCRACVLPFLFAFQTRLVASPFNRDRVTCCCLCFFILFSPPFPFFPAREEGEGEKKFDVHVLCIFFSLPPPPLSRQEREKERSAKRKRVGESKTRGLKDLLLQRADESCMKRRGEDVSAGQTRTMRTFP
jgi:hypothetical protein